MLVSEFDYDAAGRARSPSIPYRSAARAACCTWMRPAARSWTWSSPTCRSCSGRSDVLVLNDTRVIKARLPARKASGGKIELFVERALGTREALALIRASHPPAPGSELFIGKVSRSRSRRARASSTACASPSRSTQVLERYGAVPLPPYIRHAPEAEDAERYQTVYAAAPGAVAAPTAGLHFDTRDAEEDRAHAARRSQSSPCTSASAPSSRCASTRSKRTACTASATASPKPR